MIFSLGYSDLIYHLDNAEMTPELRHDLINFSFDRLQDVFKQYRKHKEDRHHDVHFFTPRFLECLKRLVRYHFTRLFSTYLLDNPAVA